MTRIKSSYLFAALLSLVIGALILSGIQPYDRFTWLLEVLPVLIVIPVLLATYKKFPLTQLLYILLCLHALILVVGGHYTYARVPLGFSLQDYWELSRNPYDRIGHFAQGFVPAIFMRELLLRLQVLQSGKWLFFIVISVCLAFSACYELLEWLAAILSAEGATEFLGAQGDMWDSQWDMFLALIGAILALLLLSKRHDAELAAL